MTFQMPFSILKFCNPKNPSLSLSFTQTFSQLAFHPKVTPIYQTSVFTFRDLEEVEAYFQQPGSSYMYTRHANPNTDELANEVAQLEDTEDAVVTSSGMSAILAGIIAFCKTGDQVLCAEEIYGGSANLLSNELPRFGITVKYLTPEQLTNLQEHKSDNTRLLLIETISNPLMRVTDISAIANQCRKLGILLMVDNTFASPILTKPGKLGADIIMHSLTKYISGHSDVSAGVIAGKKDIVAKVRHIVQTFGLNLSPFEAWLASKGLKTLRVRMLAHCENGLKIAEFLQNHPKVKQVNYPGLNTYSKHDLAVKVLNGKFGGMISFRIEDDEVKVNKFYRGLSKIKLAPSLAGVTTSVSHPMKTSHRSFPPDLLEKQQISIGLIRLSVGIEEPEQIIRELKTALDSI
jgi:cystathionine beta-lyase/cystathionine gamma-synthase